MRGFVRGMMKGLKFLYANQQESAEIAKKQFPTMPLDDLKATLDRSFADELWSKDGMISRAAWDTGKGRRDGGRHPENRRPYDDIIDMSFVESIRKPESNVPAKDATFRRRNTMDEPIWNKFLTERDKAVFANSGYGARQGFGKRPALLIIDVNYAFCDDRPMPILEFDQALAQFMRRRCLGCACPICKQLIDKAHDKGIPVIYTTGVRRDDNWDNGSWSWKNRRAEETPPPRDQRRWQRDRRRDRARSKGHRDLQAEAVRFLRHQLDELSDAARLRQHDRHRHDDVRLRARHGARRVQFELSHLARGGRLLRPLAGKPRDQSVRHEREICRRGEDVGGSGLLRRPAKRAIRLAIGRTGRAASLEAGLIHLIGVQAPPTGQRGYRRVNLHRNGSRIAPALPRGGLRGFVRWRREASPRAWGRHH